MWQPLKRNSTDWPQIPVSFKSEFAPLGPFHAKTGLFPTHVFCNQLSSAELLDLRIEQICVQRTFLVFTSARQKASVVWDKVRLCLKAKVRKFPSDKIDKHLRSPRWCSVDWDATSPRNVCSWAVTNLEKKHNWRDIPVIMQPMTRQGISHDASQCKILEVREPPAYIVVCWGGGLQKWHMFCSFFCMLSLWIHMIPINLVLFEKTSRAILSWRL